MPKTNYVLGIDGGGSKTVCVLMDAEAKVIGRGEASASNYQSIGVKAAAEAIQSAINQAISQALEFTEAIAVSAICLGLAGVSRPEDVEIIKGIVKDLQNSVQITWELKESNIVICHDALISLVGGIGHDVGIAIAAGTGSIVFGRNQQGQTKRVGGWGYLLGDEGSAYKIAIAGMQAAMRSYDGREIPTSLVSDFKNHLSLASIEQLIPAVYRSGMGVKEIAALAPIVDNAAALGDKVANNIIDAAVSELVLATSTVIDAILGDRLNLEIVTTGSVWRGKSKIRDRFEVAVLEKYPSAKVIYPRYEPAIGAGLLALNSILNTPFPA